MSRFYGGVRGDRGEATRCGHQGFNSYAQSNDFGIKTEYAYSPEGNYGVVHLTAGRNRRTGNVLIGRFEGTTFKLNPDLAQLVEQFNRENNDE